MRPADSETVAFLERHGVGIRPALAICAVLDGRFRDAVAMLENPEAAKAAPDGPSPPPKSKPKPKRQGNKARRVCAQCGEERPVQAFQKGAARCRQCVRTKGGRLLDPGIKLVRCKTCGKGRPGNAVNPDGICEECSGADR